MIPRRPASTGAPSMLTAALPILFISAIALSVDAQPRRPVRRVSIPFARFAPDSAGCFVSMRGIDGLDDALALAGVERFAAGPVGSGATADGDPPSGLYSAFRRLVGAAAKIDRSDLTATRVGFVTPSVSDFQHAIWFVRLPYAGAVDRWFARSRRTAEDRSRFADTFRTEDGLIVCVREQTMALARRWRDDDLLLETMRLMSGRSAASLDASEAFQAAHRDLPAMPTATIYFADPPDAQPHVDSHANGLVSIVRAMTPAALGVYLGEDRIDVAFSGAAIHPVMRGSLAAKTVEAVRRLPQSTLFAAAASVDFGAIDASWTDSDDPATWVRYLRLLGRLRGGGRGEVAPMPRLGPQVIAVWDQDLRVGRESPQFALLIESPDAERACDEVTAIARNLILGITSVDARGAADALRVERTSHLGTAIESVALSAFSEASRYPAAPLLANIEPAWAAHDGWLILALSRAHVERVVDAMVGFAPMLSTTPAGQTLWRPRADVRFLCVAQWRPATFVLDAWLDDLAEGAVSLLDEWWWLGPQRRDALRAERLGIGMRRDAESGAVVVARVDAGTAADGWLQPEDRILGIDGYLLSLETPNADLRRRWRERSDGAAATLRVRRRDAVMDLTLAGSPTTGAAESPKDRRERGAADDAVVEPARWVRELADIGRSISAAGVVVQAGADGGVRGEVSLRLAAPRDGVKPRPSR